LPVDYYPPVIERLRTSFKQGDWHNSLCDQLWSAVDKQPSAANLILALDATHCIVGVNDSHIDRVDALVNTRRFRNWTLFFHLCSYDIALQQIDRLDKRLARNGSNAYGFRQGRALARFPRVLNHLHHHHPQKLHHPLNNALNNSLATRAASASELLTNHVTILELLNEQCRLGSNNRVAVVGNGPSIRGSGAGRTIDESDVVIRFNDTGITAEYNADTGAKSDLWVVSPGLAFDSVPTASHRCAITGPDPWTRASLYWQTLAHQAVNQIATFELQRWHALVKLLSAPPSAGLLMIDALFQAGVPRNQITTYGFSRLQNLSSGAEDINHYRDNAPRSDRHNWSKEVALFEQWFSN